MKIVHTGNSIVVIWFLLYVYTVIQGEPYWTVNERVSGYGDNLTLFCLIDDCCTEAGGWIKFDPDYETIYLDVRNSKNNTSKDKYASTTNTTGFTDKRFFASQMLSRTLTMAYMKVDVETFPAHLILLGKNCSTTIESCVSSDGNKACVQCVVLHTGEYKGGCEGHCGDRKVIKKPSLPEGYSICEFKTEDDCIFYFTYEYDDNNELKIIARETKENNSVDILQNVPTKVNVLAIVLGVVIGIVLLGLTLLLIWKVITTINDRKLLAEFEMETRDAKWDPGEQSVYKPGTSLYGKPTYALI
ncbi:CD29 [Mytilus edulis]|uniref:ITGB1 n=1 Tax=Mytilus edulis TaxID=6550 RepID=A0A8S3QPQ1_MYTED|nr:CD29 [Mytilus edulis]